MKHLFTVTVIASLLLFVVACGEQPVAVGESYVAVPLGDSTTLSTEMVEDAEWELQSTIMLNASTGQKLVIELYHDGTRIASGNGLYNAGTSTDHILGTLTFDDATPTFLPGGTYELTFSTPDDERLHTETIEIE